MNLLDLVIAIPLLWGAYKGFQRGFIFELAMIIGLVIGLYLAFKLSGLASGLLKNMVNSDSAVIPWVSFLIVLGIVLLIVILYAKLLERILKIADLNIFNKVAGALFGIFKFALVVSVILWGLKTLEHHFNFINQSTQKESLLYDPVLKTATWLNPAFQDIKKEFKENLDKVDSK